MRGPVSTVAITGHKAQCWKWRTAARLASVTMKSRSLSPAGQSRGKAIVPSQIRSTIPFSTTDNILLIGEGNFSFARALVYSSPEILQFLPPSNVTATAYDTEEQCCSKYPDAAEIIAALREKGVELVFSVDATKLDKCAPLRGRKFDRVVWNFPHAGRWISRPSSSLWR